MQIHKIPLGDVRSWESLASDIERSAADGAATLLQTAEGEVLVVPDEARTVVAMMRLAVQVYRSERTGRQKATIKARQAAGQGWGGGVVVDKTRRGTRKLTDSELAQLVDARRRRVKGRELATRFGISLASVYRIDKLHRHRFGGGKK